MQIQMNNTAPLSSLVWNGATMTTSQEGKLVKIDTGFGVVLAGAGETVIGVIADSNLYAQGDPIPIIGIEGNIVQVLAGSAGFAVKDLIKSDASGLGITAGGTDAYFAQALESATSGNVGAVILLGGGSIATNQTLTRTGTKLHPTNVGDTIGSVDVAAEAKGITLLANTLASDGTDTNIPLHIINKGTGEPDFTNGSETTTKFMRGVKDWTQAQTGTGATVGQIAVANMTASAVIVVVAAEDPGTGLLVAYAVPTTGYFTVFTKDITVGTAAELDTKKVNYLVKSL